MTRFATTAGTEAFSNPGTAIAGRLGLAAAPTFALMALISAVSPSGMAICSATLSVTPINDMVLMYLLMSFFHLSPWLKVLSRRRHQARQTEGE